MDQPHPKHKLSQDARLSRRRLLGLAGGTATGLVALSVVGCGDDDEAKPTPTAGPDTPGPSSPTPAATGSPAAGDAGWRQPAVISSANGVLETTLVMKGESIPWGNGTRWAITVNGTTPGPTLRIRPGDRLRIKLDNQTAHSTNIHTHGLRVSPEGNADNPFIEIKGGEAFDYEIDVPDDHPSGLFWYHPHLHHHVAEQLFAGMFGAIIVEDEIDGLAEVAGATQRLVMLHDTRNTTTEAGMLAATVMETRDGREGDLVLVNGLATPDIAATSGKLERWRLLNASSSRFYRLKLDGHALNLIASDGGRLAAPQPVDELVLVPGERAEVLVQPVKAGSYTLRSLPISRGPMGASAELALATMTVAGGDASPAALPAKLATIRDPNTMNVASTRNVTMEMQMGGGPPRFVINGREFDPSRVDINVTLGTIEDWVVRNVGPMDHPFHLHVWPFQVMEQSRPGPLPRGWKDTVNVPAGGFVRVRLPFEQIGGKTVFHCHILDHEDLGMMATIEATGG